MNPIQVYTHLHTLEDYKKAFENIALENKHLKIRLENEKDNVMYYFEKIKQIDAEVKKLKSNFLINFLFLGKIKELLNIGDIHTK